jgi:hypothetical protein
VSPGDPGNLRNSLFRKSGSRLSLKCIMPIKIDTTAGQVKDFALKNLSYLESLS